jgi:hypothetical protein
MRIKIFRCLFFTGLLYTSSVHAHSIHHHDSVHRWFARDGKDLGIAVFSHCKQDTVFFEREDHSFMVKAIEDLCKADRELIQNTVNKINALHDAELGMHKSSSTEDPYSNEWGMVVVLISLALVMGLMVGRTRPIQWMVSGITLITGLLIMGFWR